MKNICCLANKQVARKLCSTEHIFDKVILRRHPSPNSTLLNNTLQILKSANIEIEGQSSVDISNAIRKVESESTQKLLIQLLAKSMQLAVYCCASCVSNNDYSHFALNIDVYTHFTSPIRRYPDILVHRLLGAVLGKLHKIVVRKKKTTLRSDEKFCNLKRKI